MSNPLRYVVVIEQAADGGFGAWAPDLPGCVALGDTIEETEREMHEAIEFHRTASASMASQSRGRLRPRPQ